jgi:sugar phosphate isomerase/epimerase
VQGGDFAVMSGDDWDDAMHAARWVAQWRELQREAFDIALKMSDANAQRHMLFVAESYALLAERAEERRKRLAILADAAKHQ